MCFTISYTNKDTKKLEKLTQAKIQNTLHELPITYVASGFTHPYWPVVTSQQPEIIQLFRWGLIPHWTPNSELADKFENNNLNARSETIFEKKSFSSAIRRQRCIIPITGFFEWREINKQKYPYYIQPNNNEFFFLGGIYDCWVNKETGEVLNTFSIITTAANPLMAKIHNRKQRMPFILPYEHIREWLNPNLEQVTLQTMMKPFDDHQMKAHTISKRIASKTSDPNVVEVLEPVEYPELTLIDI
ncbi:MAG: SOS response-associated peptidase [Flavobacteriales bacterium]|nr:SOS response-associated peptidase [Flavobacteriales bacterium]